jgi:hypothetical protein
MISLIRTPEPSALVTSEPQKFPFEKLPKEIQLDIVEKMGVKRAINFGAASHKSWDLVENNKKLWTRHGVHFPVALPGSPITLKQVWISSRIALLSPEARLALPNLQKPLDISSDTALQNFSESVREIDAALGRMNQAIGNSNGPAIFDSVSQVRETAESVGLEMPNLPVDQIKPFYVEEMSRFMEQAQRDIKGNCVALMKNSLENAFRWTKEFNLELPPLSLENVSPKARIAYFEKLEVLKSRA